MAFISSENNKLKCILCPHNCSISGGSAGVCRIRQNRDGNLFLPWHGILSAVNMDPIEKKPLYHFLPGSKVVSAGFYGCNFHCQFCQNYQISQEFPKSASGGKMEPEELVNTALQNGVPSVAYTYSEPVIHFEYISECSAIARARGIKNVLVTNGYLNKEPANELLGLIDGVNVDLKAFTERFYKKLGGKLGPVKDFIKIASKLTHLEVTTLVIPGENDSESEIMDIAGFLADLDINIPLHLSCYYPVYNYKIEPTQAKSILSLANKATEVLNFVYPGNVGHEIINTYCSECGNTLVSRRGYNVSTRGIKDKSCSKCGMAIPFPVV